MGIKAKGEMSLRAKVALALMCIALPLLAVLAYNLGFVAEEDQNASVLKNYGDINQVVRDRMASCKRKQDDKKSDNDLERWDIQQFRDEEMLLQQENDLLHDTNEARQKVSEKCESNYDKMMDNRYEQATIGEEVTRLMFENDELEMELMDQNETKKEQRFDMKERIRALRLENKQMRADNDAWEAEVARENAALQEWEEEQKKWQEEDWGFGERDVDSDWLDQYQDGKDKDLYADFDKGFRNEPNTVYGTEGSWDEAKAEEAWAEWDRQMEEQMQNEDPDWLEWDDWDPNKMSNQGDSAKDGEKRRRMRVASAGLRGGRTAAK